MVRKHRGLLFELALLQALLSTPLLAATVVKTFPKKNLVQILLNENEWAVCKPGRVVSIQDDHNHTAFGLIRGCYPEERRLVVELKDLGDLPPAKTVSISHDAFGPQGDGITAWQATLDAPVRERLERPYGVAALAAANEKALLYGLAIHRNLGERWQVELAYLTGSSNIAPLDDEGWHTDAFRFTMNAVQAQARYFVYRYYDLLFGMADYRGNAHVVMSSGSSTATFATGHDSYVPTLGFGYRRTFNNHVFLSLEGIVAYIQGINRNDELFNRTNNGDLPESSQPLVHDLVTNINAAGEAIAILSVGYNM